MVVVVIMFMTVSVTMCVVSFFRMFMTVLSLVFVAVTVSMLVIMSVVMRSAQMVVAVS